MNFYKRHLGDIAKACGHLSQAEMGCYDLLLDWIYANEKPLPFIGTSLYRIGRAFNRAERSVVEKIIEEFFEKKEHGYVQKRAILEIEKANAQAEANRLIALKRESTKRATNAPRSVVDSCEFRGTKWQPSQTPDSKEQELPTANAVGAKEVQPEQPPLLPTNVTPLPIDPKAALWSEWKKLSGDDGSFLGKMLKAHGEGAVLAKVGEVLTKRPGEPKSFLRKLLAPNPGRAGRVDNGGWILDEHGNRTGKRGAVV